jgi:hypothetical protein
MPCSPAPPRPRNAACRRALLLAIAAIATACSSTPVPTEGGAGGGASTALSEALALVPSDAAYLTVTDWAAVKAADGHADVTSTSSSAERHQAYVDIYAREATASRFASDTVAFELGSTVGSPPPEGPSDQAREWGFDALDLRWDASVFEPGASQGVLLLRLRQGIDLGALASRFDQRGFASEQVAGITVRDEAGGLYPSSRPAVSPAMSNTAFLPDGQTLAMSTSLAELKVYLAAMSTGAPEAMTSAAGQLDHPWASAILAGAPACGYFDPPAGWSLDQAFSDSLEAEITAAGPLSAFQAVAIGYARGRTPASRITFIYGAASDASHDLDGRRRLAEGADRLAADHQPYAGSVFTVTGAEVADRAIDLDVAPANDQPIALFEAFASRDLVPAVCRA